MAPKGVNGSNAALDIAVIRLVASKRARYYRPVNANLDLLVLLRVQTLIPWPFGPHALQLTYGGACSRSEDQPDCQVQGML